MAIDQDSDSMRVKLEIDESAGDLDVAREKFDSALQDLFFKEEVSDSEAEDVQNAKQEPSADLSAESMETGLESAATQSSRPPRKRRRKDTEPDQLNSMAAGNNQQSSFVVRIFDRSIDLAQFAADAPLYPICRAWLLNEPNAERGTGLTDLNAGTPSPPEGADLPEVLSLPPPTPWGPEYADRLHPLIPAPLPAPPLVRRDTALGSPSASELLNHHLQHWKNVRQTWKKASAAADARYDESATILREIFSIHAGGEVSSSATA
ncbi:protein lin-37 homolog [Hyalella azteca]|uniref:Protein lin-37 homolog n=1 Tax=Hyalella azteca TaxID=294128 RepID=A0A8B7PHY5_HYAAZ|nr:protein lin-37 homolog [Hyalella azteca]